jgi:hypothetical protein
MQSGIMVVTVVLRVLVGVVAASVLDRRIEHKFRKGEKEDSKKRVLPIIFKDIDKRAGCLKVPLEVNAGVEGAIKVAIYESRR